MNVHSRFLLRCSKVVKLDELVGISHSHPEVLSHLVSIASLRCAPSSYSSCATNCLYSEVVLDGYYVAYKLITLSCIFFMFIEMKFIHCHSCVMFAMKSMSIYND